jgi:hypothetical protein
MILSLANDEPESVMTTGGSYLHQQIADATTTHLEFRCGAEKIILYSTANQFTS